MPRFATFHVEFLEPPKEHDQDKDELSFVTPSSRKPNPWISAGAIVFQSPGAAVSRWEPYVPISTAYTHLLLIHFSQNHPFKVRYCRNREDLQPDDFEGDVEHVKVEWILFQASALSDANQNNENRQIRELRKHNTLHCAFSFSLAIIFLLHYR